ncbi:cell division control protein 45 homolog [Antedon mediterranea]|uniref:cell division control protein 45 homolog n=1 Tax=Antedon mediterranea TaxID=105859 RepID=UPI003AF6C548
MLISDLRKEFYDVILHKHVLLMVAFDVDALCACKILISLFQCDSVHYTLVPVSGQQDLERAFLEHSEQIKHVVLINCGANINLLDVLQPEDDVTFFVCDSHRPIDLVNVYNDTQVKLLLDSTEQLTIPSYEDIFNDEESDSDDSGNESESSQPDKRRRLDEESIVRKLEKKRARRLWEESRQKIIFQYEEFSFYSTSAAYVIYQLAWKLSKDSNDLLWWSIIGLTDQLLSKKIDREKYFLDASELNRHVSRHNRLGQEEDATQQSVNAMKITFNPELQLALYRHWSLFDSICHSSYTACNLRLWTARGFKKLHEFLADMGMPLTQCKQKFTAMDIAYRETFCDSLQNSGKKYGLDQITVPSFYAQFGYKNKFCAFDAVHAASALLESIEKDKVGDANFLEALDALSRVHLDKLECGLEISKRQHKAIVSQIRTLLDMNHVVSAGPFLYAYIQEGTLDVKFFSKANCLALLARFTLEAFVKMSKSKKVKNLPLVMVAPLNFEQGTSLVVGVPPLMELENSPRSLFGRAFEQTAEKTGSRVLHDSFDPSIFALKTEDRSKFFDALVSLLS